MVTEGERDWMWEEYAPEPRMRLNLGIRRRLAPLLDNEMSKITLVNSLLFTLPGSPVIYYGDEIGMGDNIWLEDRHGVRTPMQWDDGLNAGFSNAPVENLYAPIVDRREYAPRSVNVDNQLADDSSLYHWTRKMISLRKAYKAFGRGDFSWANLTAENPAVAAYWRTYREERLLVVNNLSSKEQSINLSLKDGGQGSIVELIENTEIVVSNRGVLELSIQPYEFLWFVFL